MSIHTPISTCPPASDPPIPDTLVHSLLCLLDRAGLDLLHAPESAGHAIDRAAAILRVEVERRASDQRRKASLGELASWQVARVTAYVDAHLDQRIQVQDLSAVARRSTAHFCRLFKRTLGETPHGFITSRRLHRAQQLMLTSDDPLSQIAMVCGFSDQAHFCNRFRAAMGLSPTAWRRERRETTS
jgi:AraC family transcriptional regulator